MVHWCLMTARIRHFFCMLISKPHLVRRRLSSQLTTTKSSHQLRDAAVQHIRLDQLLPESSLSKYAILLLNCNYRDVPFRDQFARLWCGAAVRFAVDGGANLLHDLVEPQADATYKCMKPDVVCGDFDSIRPDVLKSYQADADVQVISTPDQNSTDFVKCLTLLHDRCHAKSCQIDYIVAVQFIGGRLDHLMGNLDALYHAGKIFKPSNDTQHGVPLVLLSFMPSKDSTDLRPTTAEIQTQCLLTPGVAWRIHVNFESVGLHCGLIPLSGATRVHTKGLRWNMGVGEVSGETLEFGGLVSTSNAMDKDVIEVEVQDNPLLWTCNLRIPL